MKIKRILTFVDEVRSKSGRRADPPLRKSAVVAIVQNPFAGRYVEDLSPLTVASEPIGREICAIAVALLAPYKPASYGKAAVVGLGGEQEHGNAMLTTVYGNVMREAAGGGQSVDFFFHKTRGAWGRDRHPACAQRRIICPIPLRRDRHYATRRSAGGRNSRHLCVCDTRTAQPSRRWTCGG